MSELPRSFGSYTLLKLLARGGMGEIFLARTAGITGFEKYYAVKKLLKKFTHDNDVGARFIDEAKLGARLQHPNIVQVYDLGRVTEELYMATEFVDGFDLRRVLRFCHEKKKRIPLDIALFVVREILSGLAYAHRQVDAEGHSINLIHRDISPQNVLVSFEGEVKIIDFGLAKSTQRSQETQANVLLGNFGYMSPEQARGHQLDVRTDVYSAGIVLFELATGTKRFVEENPLRLLEMVARPTAIVPSDRVPETPKTIDRIYEKATAPDKEERYESAEAFRDDVTTALHRINPKASRENLAQFLNHLFLGGAAPAPVDAEALDRSVAIRARDLHEGSDAFQAPVESDSRDRRLHEFADDAPQTASHALMRAARVGDALTHAELTGEPLAAAVEAPPSLPAKAPAPVAAMAVPITSLPTGAPPVTAVQIVSAAPVASLAQHEVLTTPPLQIDVSVPDLVTPMPPPPMAASSNPLDMGADLHVTAPHDVVNLVSSSELLVDVGPPIGQNPTSIYDSPSWPGELDRRAAESEPTSVADGAAIEIGDEAVDVISEIGAELQAELDAQAEVQRQLDVQADLQRQLEQAQADDMQDGHEQQGAQRAAEAARGFIDAKTAADTKAADRAALERAAVAEEKLQEARMPRVEASRVPAPPPGAAPAAPPPMQFAAVTPPASSVPPSASTSSVARGQNTVVTTVGPSARRSSPSPSEQPSIVVAMDLEPSQPTLVSGALPLPGRASREPVRTAEAAPVRDVRAGGFAEGDAHESLIIDFETDVVDDSDKNIRPAAQPLGKRVATTVVQPPAKPGRPPPIPRADDPNAPPRRRT